VKVCDIKSESLWPKNEQNQNEIINKAYLTYLINESFVTVQSSLSSKLLNGLFGLSQFQHEWKIKVRQKRPAKKSSKNVRLKSPAKKRSQKLKKQATVFLILNHRFNMVPDVFEIISFSVYLIDNLSG
jgi:hypothetical protein